MVDAGYTAPVTAQRDMDEGTYTSGISSRFRVLKNAFIRSLDMALARRLDQRQSVELDQARRIDCLCSTWWGF